MKIVLNAVAIFIMIFIFWVILFQGIVDEAERQANQKSNRKWLVERALNQYEAEQMRGIK